MEYTQAYQYLSVQFNLAQERCHYPRAGTESRQFGFNSQQDFYLPVHANKGSELKITTPYRGNSEFRYPVFIPQGAGRQHEAVFLLHGLNERSWDKYLTWASELAISTGKAVILFPIAYHINRSPEDWSNPRAMAAIMRQRKTVSKAASFANAALSTRLEHCPALFCTSGMQSFYDIMQLISHVRKDEHPLLKPDCHFDFFAYSIGAFLTQILMLTNPGDVFKNSRTFLFCGGASFEDMRGTSKYIMDNRAFQSLKNYYLDQEIPEIKKSLRIPCRQDFQAVWTSFVSMLKKEYLTDFREGCFFGLKNRMMAINLKKDRVIPSDAIVQNLKAGSKAIKHYTIDLPYAYTHENPFPLSQNVQRSKTDRAFRQIFGKATAFLNKKN